MINSVFSRSKYSVKYLLVFCFAILCGTSCKNDVQDAANKDTSNDLYTVAELRALFDQKKPLDWSKEKDAKFIVSIAVHSKTQISIGFKSAHVGEIRDNIRSYDYKSKEWKEVEDKIVKLIMEEEGKENEDSIKRPRNLPYIIAKIESLSTIEKLLKMEGEIRYIAPLDLTILMPEMGQ